MNFVPLQKSGRVLKGFFDNSAHAQFLRNLICVPVWNKAIV